MICRECHKEIPEGKEVYGWKRWWDNKKKTWFHKKCLIKLRKARHNFEWFGYGLFVFLFISSFVYFYFKEKRF